MEIGAALASAVPVFSNAPALDVTVGEYVTRVANYEEVLARIGASRRSAKPAGVLVDPAHAIDESINALCDLRPALLGNVGNRGSDTERQYENTRRKLVQTFRLPSF
jgi:hypothetical protein